jgi:hypothetical protein
MDSWSVGCQATDPADPTEQIENLDSKIENH